MKKFFIIFIFIIMSLNCDIEDSNNNNYPGVAGKKYVGKPDELNPYPGCEGCGQEGYFKFFSADNEVQFIWPGSDIMDGGTYEQTKFEVKINSFYGDIHYLTVSEDGKEVADNKNGIVFRDENYPW